MNTRSAAFGMLIMAMPVAVIAQTPPKQFTLSADSRVRGLDREARRLLEVALDASPTVARMVVALETTDLIVGVETRAYADKTWGELRLIAATPDVRHVRITLRTPNGEAELISVLGHELQHAMELAAAPEVRDQAAQRAYYQRIGWRAMGTRYIDTDAALNAGRRVAADVAAAKSARKAKHYADR